MTDVILVQSPVGKLEMCVFCVWYVVYGVRVHHLLYFSFGYDGFEFNDV